MNDHIKAQDLKPGMQYRLSESNNWVTVSWVYPRPDSDMVIVALKCGCKRLLMDSDQVQILIG